MVDAQEAVIGIAETIQTAHLERAPNAKLDNAPETSFDTKQTVHFEADSSEDVDSNVDGDEVPLSLLRPAPRRPQMPPLPDLRFEQSYLHSIKHAEGWHGIAYITVRDQVFMPLVQGLGWTLVVAGWRHWNTAANFRGQTIGARIRRWWWEVNDWTVPETRKN